MESRSQKTGKSKITPGEIGEILATVLPFIAGIFGVLVFFITLLTKLDSNPSVSMLGGVGMILFAAILFYFRNKLVSPGTFKAKATSDPVSEQRMANRLENLEALICRLDRELNQQIEQSLFAVARNSLPATGVSQMPTSMVNIASALGERYQMLGELGRGGMGVVIQAYDKELKEQVAIKILSPMLSFDPEALERLRREVSAARRVTHPNVIRIYDISQSNGVSYVSMEYFEGTNLKEFIRSHNPLSHGLVLQIANQICDGVHAAHQQGVIHRDLKSQNIIINHANEIKVIDFGLARSRHLEGMTATGLIMGTPEYMAPEQVAGRKTDERSDIYSLGIILYELITGCVPFSGESAISIGFKHINDEPTPPSQINPRVGAELEQIILKSLRKEPQERYSSVAELKVDLTNVFQSALQSIQQTSQRAESPLLSTTTAKQ